MTIRTKSLIKKTITWESTSKALKQSFSLFWTVTEPVTYCGIGNNKRQSFHDCMRLLEKFYAFLLRLPVSKGCLVLLVFFLTAENCAYPMQTLKGKFWHTVI